MKLRPFLILLLFVASAGILVWIYYTATYDRRPAKESPWVETMSDLDACSRRKHVKSAQYDHFATVADKDSRPDAARLFRAMALSERLQENNCASAIVNLGGKYTPPTKVVVFNGTTVGNLDRSMSFELQSIKELHGADIDRAIQKGNRYAARVLIWAAAGDMKHIILMKRCREVGTIPAADSCRYLVCPTCGNIYEAQYADRYCPACLTNGLRFIHFD